MAHYRRDRINDEMTRALSEILRSIKDPRIQKNLVTITASSVTADLKYATIYFSVIGRGADPTEVRQGLESAKGYIRRELARSLNLRITPELTFHHDSSAEHGAHIMELLKSVDVPEETEEQTTDE